MDISSIPVNQEMGGSWWADPRAVDPAWFSGQCAAEQARIQKLDLQPTAFDMARPRLTLAQRGKKQRHEDEEVL